MILEALSKQFIVSVHIVYLNLVVKVCFLLHNILLYHHYFPLISAFHIKDSKKRNLQTIREINLVNNWLTAQAKVNERGWQWFK